MPGVLPLLSVVAADVHGATAEAYITISIDDYMPSQRSPLKQRVFPSVVNLTEMHFFTLEIPDNSFYDPQGSKPLVFFVEDPAGTPLPSWIQFNPMTRNFYGITPQYPTT